MAAGTFQGADVAQLRALSHLMHAAALVVRHIEARLTRQLGAVGWQGPDADQARETWAQIHAVTLRSAGELLHTTHQHLLAQADEQDTASGVGGGTVGTGIGSRLPSSAAGTTAGIAGTNPVGNTSTTMSTATIDPTTNTSAAEKDWAAIKGTAGDLGHLSTLEQAYAVLKAGVGHPTIRDAARAVDEFRDTLGPTIGGISDGLGMVGLWADATDTIDKYMDGDTPGAILSGVSTGIGVVGLIPAYATPAGVAGIGWTIGTEIGDAAWQGMQGTSYGDRVAENMDWAYHHAGVAGALYTPVALAEAAFDGVWEWLTGSDDEP